ncbi:MAG: hypothetical protein M3Q23_18415 [Actinomycetota bacterium]|nr:hypothetical protein [Actinomycetota bacterium]
MTETDHEIRRRLGTTRPDVPTFQVDAADVMRRARARRVRRSVGVAAAAVLILAGVGLPLALLSALGGSHRPIVSPSPPSPAVRAVLGPSIRIPSGAVDVAVEDGTVWVSGFGKLTRLDAGSGRVVATVSTPGTEDYSQVAVGFGAVWVTADRGILYRVDPATDRVVLAIAVGGPIQGVDTGAGSVWVTRIAGEHGDLIRVDPATGRVVGRPIKVGPGPGAVLYAYGAVWVTNTSPPSVDRVDPTTREVTDTRFTGLVAAGYGSLWAVSSGTSPSSSFVVRVDPMTGESIATVRVPRAEAAAVGAGGVWVLAGPRSSSPTLFHPIEHTTALWEIDPSTNRIVGHPILFEALQPIAISATAGDRAVWVADYDGGTVTRFDVVPCAGSACRA